MTNPTHDSEDMPVTTTDRLEAVQAMGQTAAAQLLWTALKVIVTLVITGSAYLATGYVRDIRDSSNQALAKIAELEHHNDQQDTEQQLLTQRVSGLTKVSDATVSALQAMGDQVKHNTYDMDSFKSNAAYNARKSRP